MSVLAPVRRALLHIAPGKERWSVKTGCDPDAAAVPLAPRPTTIAQLRAIPAPSRLPNTRIPSAEEAVYTVSATLTGYKEEADGDYHLVLADEHGQTMIAEIPNPGFVGIGSPFLKGIVASRSTFDAHFAPSGRLQPVRVPVSVTGVAFLDRIHGQDGVAPNGIELHPVLSISFP